MKTTRRPITKRNAPRRLNTGRVDELFTVEKIIVHARPVNHAGVKTWRRVSELLPAVLALIAANKGGAQ